MEFVVIAYTLFGFMAATLIFGYFGRKNDFKQKRIDYIEDLKKNPLFSELEVSFLKRSLSKASVKFNKFISETLSKNKSAAATKKPVNKTLERQLRLAGIFIDPQEFSIIKLVAVFAALILFTILSFISGVRAEFKLLIILVGMIVGFIAPTMYLRMRVTSHQQKIRDQLPNALDLLGVCIEAGLSFDMSLVKVSEKMKGPFIDELMIIHREMQMGKQRRDALQDLSDNTDIQELKTFTAALVQAEQLGIPIINVMRIQSVQLRQTRKQIAQEKGMKAPIKMMIPMVGLVFPVVLIILMGPTVNTMIETFIKK